MRSRLLLLIPLLLAIPLAVTADELPEGMHVDLAERFNHGHHRRALDRAELTCQGCHQVGLEGEELPEVPKMACHGCHVQPDPGATRWSRAPTTCGSCHEEIQRPESHSAAWLSWHGTERDASCSDCHSRSFCVECHERREEPDLMVHPRTWLTTHGVEAGAGMACDSCHARSECLSCHEETP